MQRSTRWIAAAACAVTANSPTVSLEGNSEATTIAGDVPGHTFTVPKGGQIVDLAAARPPAYGFDRHLLYPWASRRRTRTAAARAVGRTEAMLYTTGGRHPTPRDGQF